jgi:hypothetical protein
MLGQIFVYDAIAGGKKSQNVCNEMTLAIVEPVPIALVLAQINLFGCPKTGFGLFVVLPNVGVGDREEHKSIFVLLQNGFSG